MKKLAIFGLTAFYVLLTTGMYTCLVHCSFEDLIEKFDNSKTHTISNEHHKDDDCNDDDCKGDDCDCCKIHGTFVINENVKPEFAFQVLNTTSLATHQTFLPDFILSTNIKTISYLPDCHAPPGKSGKTISIILHSLQI